MASVYVELKGADWNFDEAQQRAAFANRTKAIIVNTPHNPTGKVFTRKELALIAELCLRHYADLVHKYSEQRTVLCDALQRAGFEFHPVQGAHYVMTDCRPFGWDDDVAFVKEFLIPRIGVAAVPGSSFFEPRTLGAGNVRFMFAKKPQTLEEAGRRLAKPKQKS